MASIAMTVRTSIEPDGDRVRRQSTHVVVVLGQPITARAFGEVARALAAVGANIDAIRRVADYPVTGLELMVSRTRATGRYIRTARCAPSSSRWPLRPGWTSRWSGPGWPGAASG